MKYLYLFIFFGFLFLTCCMNNAGITNGNVIYIQQFEREEELEGEKLEYIDSFGFMGCELVYPYLLLNLYKQSEFIALYHLEKEEYIGLFFSKGEGPEEFLAFNIVNRINNGSVWIDDPIRRKLKEYVFMDTINAVKAIEQNVIEYREENDVYSIFPIKDESFVYKAFAENKGVYLKTKKREIYPYKEVFTRNDMNRTSQLADCINTEGTKWVSLSGVFDQIDIISLSDEEKSISVTTATSLTSWETYRNKNEEDLMEYYLTLPRCNDSYIAALHNQNGNKEIILIDWSGNGICRWKIKENIIDFCIDWERNKLYGVTEDENIYCYHFKL
ncbi:MAG: hypothetical protein E7099_09140 [Mediterranea massiliensis]|nr:hypothetical protein [Mediterranea massiliensis]